MSTEYEVIKPAFTWTYTTLTDLLREGYQDDTEVQVTERPDDQTMLRRQTTVGELLAGRSR